MRLKMKKRQAKINEKHTHTQQAKEAKECRFGVYVIQTCNGIALEITNHRTYFKLLMHFRFKM